MTIAPALTEAQRAAVLRGVAAAQACEPEYALRHVHGLSSHLPMAVAALAGLGGDAARIDAFADRYLTKLSPLAPATGAVDAATWREGLGRHRDAAGYIAFFEREAQSLGLSHTLRTYLPALVPGLSGGAFHPLIRLAYGLDFGIDSEVVHGLAYWCAAYLELGELATAGDVVSDPAAQLARAAGAQLGTLTQGALIFDRMAAVARHPGFAAAAAFTPGPGALESIARTCARLHAATDDFTTLHMVTATHAMRLVLPFLGDPASALRYLWQAQVAAYVSLGCPPLAAPGAVTAPDWPEIAASALESTDEHVLKLVYTCGREHAIYGDELCRWIAARKAGLIG